MSYHHKNHKCKARNKECFNCKKVGHLARVCFTKSYRNVVKTKSFKSIQKPHKKKRENIYINLMTNIEGNNVNVDILGIKTKGLIDTGAAVSCISSCLFNKLDKTKIKVNLSRINNVYGVGGEGISVKGQVKLPLKFDKEPVVYQNFYIIDKIQHSLIIGNDFLEYNKANINYPTKTLNLYDGIAQIALISTRQNEAKTLKHIELPARKISIIPVKIPKQYIGKQIILEPSQSLQNSIVGAACLVSPSNQQAVMQVINANEDKVVLNKMKL